MNPLPPLRSLQVFEVVGHSRSLAEAARRLGISSGAISQQLKLLETTLDANLTVKDGRQVRLTAAGQRFHGACTTAFELLREAQAELERARNDANLSISALPSVLTAWLAPLVFDWQDRYHPTLNIQFKASHAEPDSDVEDIDFRITYDTTRPNRQNTIELFTDCVVPVCSPALLRPNAALNQPADILRYPLLATDWRPKFASPPAWADWFAACGVDARKALAAHPIRRTFSLSHMTIESALAGQGFALVQASMVYADVMAGRLLIPFKRALPLPRPYVLKWHPDTFHKPQCRAFHRWLVVRGKHQAELNAQLLA
ncbi:LysR substrate-binding domain-containing protein [Castellaniella hirudinis]|uniref:LysR substrate-binding domain-containing protein n=1 Tax=Castellaniella hirudinis TaxID=1144617 RepID=UPI0039C47077